MVSYSRLRPAMSRDEPTRCCFEPAAAGDVGGAAGRAGSVPVVLMWSPSGRQARVATDKELLGGRRGIYHDIPRLSRPACLAPFFGHFGLALKRFMAAGRPWATIISTASAARPTISGSTAASAREKSDST